LIKTNLLFLPHIGRLDPQRYHKIFEIEKAGFEMLALQVFQRQAREIEIYALYLDALKVNPARIGRIEDIPYLPIRFFKTHTVTDSETPQTIFESSGTTQTGNSRHFVADLSLYENSFLKCFELFYGPVTDWCILGLLPSYLERQHSSLVYMTNKLIEKSGRAESGFYMDQHERLFEKLSALEKKKQKTWLIGASFGLLDFAEKYTIQLDTTIVIETGGMKGRKVELVRDELHTILKNAFHTPHIHSEYGMTELLSQAYSIGEGVFECPPWMRILVRDDEDPFLVKKEGKGVINVIDLANIHSCSFIATDDAGILNSDGSFEIWGRIDGSDLRGCSLLVAAV
jgi:hypothetical protein